MWGQLKAQVKSTWGVVAVNTSTKWGFPKTDVSTAKGIPVVKTLAKWGFPICNVSVTDTSDEEPLPPDDDTEEPLPPDFPGGDIIDNFNRVENPLSTGWAKTASNWLAMMADGSKAVPLGPIGNHTSVYRNGSKRVDDDGYYTIVTSSDMVNGFAGLWFRLHPDTVGGDYINLSGYMVVYWYPDIVIYKKLAGEEMAPITSLNRILADGTKLGARISGTDPVNIVVYTDEGAGWVERINYNDSAASRIKTKGHKGIHAYTDDSEEVSYTFDNFGGM